MTTTTRSHTLAVDGILSALDGIAYATDDEGTIIAIGGRNWDAALARNGGRPEFRSREVIGRNLFEFIDGEAVVGRYREWMRSLRHERDGVAFAFRCDAPGERRELRMAITRMELDGGRLGCLFHSTALSSAHRPPIDLFDVDAQITARREALAKPHVTLCSFCHAVDAGARELASWVTPEAYYAAGGRSDVRISHGICPGCATTLPG
ncbi:MAG: PAS domain-containing protein [Salinarimonas sp.]